MRERDDGRRIALRLVVMFVVSVVVAGRRRFVLA
jgi:hypothetical protein